MMRDSKYILLPSVLALLFLSCGKDPGGESVYLDSVIGISTQVSAPGKATKAFLTSIDNDNTTVQVYDYLSDFTGKIVVDGVDVTAEDGDFFEYFGDVLEYPGGDGAWTYSSGNSYRWTRSGTHNFFGWLLDDAGQTGLNYNAFFGENPSYDSSTMTLTIPQKTITTSTTQFDFLYAPTYSLAPGNAGYGQLVPLSFSHLFTALNITIQNVSDNRIVLKNVESDDMYNTRGALINFSTGQVYYVNSTEGNFIPALPSNQPLAAETGTYTLWSGHKIMWPQTAAEMENAKLLITYDILDDEDVPTEYTSTVELKNIRISGVPITDTGLEAGKKYTLTLQFKNGSIDLLPFVAPWTYSEESWDYADNSIAARTGNEFHDGVLMLYKNSVAGTNYTIELTNTSEVINGEFYIEAPLHGRWQVSLYPAEAAQYFTITPHEGNIDMDMMSAPNNGKVAFTITASSAAPEYTVTAYFNVSIYMGNEWHDANSEFNRKNWKVIRVVS